MAKKVLSLLFNFCFSANILFRLTVMNLSDGDIVFAIVKLSKFGQWERGWRPAPKKRRKNQYRIIHHLKVYFRQETMNRQNIVKTLIKTEV